jgi:transposase
VRPRGNPEIVAERRVEAIRLIEQEDWTQAAVAKKFKVSVRAVQYWIQSHRGRKAKPDRKPGRPRRLSEPDLKRLRLLVLKGAKEAGFSSDLWTCPRIRQLIRREFGITFHVDHLPRLLRSLGFNPQKPMRRAVERDEQAIKRWVEIEWNDFKKKPSESAPRSRSSTKPGS